MQKELWLGEVTEALRFGGCQSGSAALCAEFSLNNAESCPRWTRHEWVTEHEEMECVWSGGADIIPCSVAQLQMLKCLTHPISVGYLKSRRLGVRSPWLFFFFSFFSIKYILLGSGKDYMSIELWSSIIYNYVTYNYIAALKYLLI